ncbi:MAG: DNA repair protein RecO [Proteobacteria bacterium]|nr:DNA repair protein RecO [Pseudomonadota bacterium]
MKFNDCGIIISLKKYGENSLIVKVFSQHHGIYSGFVKSVRSSKDKVNYQIGNLISFEYRSRIEENLGQFFAVDLIRSYCAKMMFDKLRLSCVNSLFSIIDSVFLEREQQQLLFEKLRDFLQKLSNEDISKKDFLADYVKLELKILKTLGYAVDLSSCAVTQTTDDLVFVSPKSARAVSYEAGKPYQSKLLKLPSFLINDEEHDEDQLLEGLKLSGYFLEKFVFEEKNYSEKKQQFFHRDSIKNSLLKN